MAKKRKAYYGVREGRIRGVYDNWESCKAQVEKCPNKFRGFDTFDEAAFYVATGQTCHGASGTALFAEWKRAQLSNTSSNRIEKEKKPHIKVEAFDASQSYFSQVPNFEPDDKADFDDEFGRLASSQNIAPGSQAWRQKRTDAIRHEMIFHYSQKVDYDDYDVKEEGEDKIGLLESERETRRKLEAYQNMCREVGLEALDTIDGCVANLKSVLVNIVDYINAKRNARPIKVWGPHEFGDFKKYTLGPNKRIDLETARSGDGFLAALLQVLRPSNAANVYQGRRDRALIAREDYTSRVSSDIASHNMERCLTVVKEEPSTPDGVVRLDCEVISIHGTESDPSRSPQSINGEIVDTTPWSPSSIGSSIIEVLSSHQKGIKRDLDDLMKEDSLLNEVALASMNKRQRA
ncbi:hypothetical protein NUW58_g4433 [Xylaria curta]|uniref:Uncharacterized protein n=1 Tax=Xylaria curta TaxID=42375 RepID=A0ACC1P7P7_9PEZI|nr:hypothetical protein NUW58_g4433 [Xylaria curta]